MTPSQMSQSTRQALAGLPTIAKAELSAWLRNKLQPLVLEIDTTDAAGHRTAAARRSMTAVEIALDELREILSVERNAHLGARR